MSNRALITGIGEKYTGTALPALNATINLSEISVLLSIKNWDSIDHIDDNDLSFLDTSTNKIITDDTTQPTSSNILKAINDIIKFDPATNNLLFYFTGHGLKFGRLFMVTYDEEYFNDMNLDRPPSSLLIDDNYIQTINGLLEKNLTLTVLTVIDCCFAGCVIISAKKANKFLDRHIIFCSVDVSSSARAKEKSVNVFTGKFCRAVRESTTYLEIKNKIISTSGNPLPEILLPNSFNNTVHPL